MKKRSLHFAMMVAFLGLTTSLVAQWTVYDCSTTPDQADPVWVKWDFTEGVTDVPEAVLCTVVDDPGIPGNKWLRIEELMADKSESWAYEWSAEEAGTSTVIMRVKPTDSILTHVDTSTAVCQFGYLGVLNGSFKHQLKINSTGMEWKKGDDNIIPIPDYDFHTYRVSVNLDVFNVYLDEAEIPILSGTNNKSTGDLALLIGAKVATVKHGGDYDWIIWDLSGAYAPGEGTAIPDSLLPAATSTRELVSENAMELSTWPNPFSSALEISYLVNKESITMVDIYDLNGRHVKSLVNQSLPAGLHTVSFDGSDLPAGIYFCKLRSGEQVAIQKMMHY